MVLHIVYYDIGGLIIYFYAVVTMIIEGLEGPVGAKCNQFSVRMPIGIDKGTDCGIGFGIQFLYVGAIYYHGATESSAGMENKFLGISFAVCVAVKTVASCGTILYYSIFMVVFQVALINSQFIPSLITRRNETIR